MASGIDVAPPAIEEDIKRLERQHKNLVDLLVETGDRALLTRRNEVEERLAERRAAFANASAWR